MTTNSREFDWHPDSGDSEHCVVIQRQLSIAVYRNPRDEVVIRQEDEYGDEDDIIFVYKDNVLKLVERLLAEGGIEAKIVPAEDAAPPEPLLLPKPAPLSGAERQRRYRNKHRNVAGDGDVTTVTRRRHCASATVASGSHE
jgi:hypothetical protein